VDADVAVTLMDKTKIKVGDDGAVTGAKEALEALKESKPYLFGTPAPKAQALKQGAPAAGEKTARDEIKEATFGKK
jgi:hypothetical protein